MIFTRVLLSIPTAIAIVVPPQLLEKQSLPTFVLGCRWVTVVVASSQLNFWTRHNHPGQSVGQVSYFLSFEDTPLLSLLYY